MLITVNTMSLKDIRKVIKNEKNPVQAGVLRRFFKTGKGQYGEGDVFYGIKVPVQRRIVKSFNKLAIDDIKELIKSKVHEERLIAILILVEQFKSGDENLKKIIYKTYLDNRKYINNWDLVDLSAPNIVGDYLLNRDRKILYQFAKSNDLWEKRIAMLSTFTFIRNNLFNDSLKIAEILLNDEHDLIHKAVGWMLREIGKRDIKTEEGFLRERYKIMPRTMLRYSIEKFPENKRKSYLNNKI